jgi:hypothetical protein
VFRASALCVKDQQNSLAADKLFGISVGRYWLF